MSAADSRSDRTRRRDDAEEDVSHTTEVGQPGPQPSNETVGAAINDSQIDLSSLTAQLPPSSAEVQTVPEQIRK